MSLIIIDEPADYRVQAIFLKGHLKLLKLGLRNSRLSQRAILAKTSAITCEKYSNSQAGVELAIKHLEKIINRNGWAR